MCQNTVPLRYLVALSTPSIATAALRLSPMRATSNVVLDRRCVVTTLVSEIETSKYYSCSKINKLTASAVAFKGLC